MYCSEWENIVVQVLAVNIRVETYQHGGTEVKLIKELRDKDVHLHQTLLVCLLDFTNDLSKPLVLLLGAGHPYKEHLEKKGYEINM